MCVGLIDLCEHVIKYCKELEAQKGSEYSITNLKLQKILYFLQGFYSSEFNDQLFANDIRAWEYGPVVVDAYFRYNRYGAMELENSVEDIDLKVPEGHVEFINSVIEGIAKKSSAELVSDTHKEAPWKIAYKKGKDTVIGYLDIKEYFENKKWREIAQAI